MTISQTIKGQIGDALKKLGLSNEGLTFVVELTKDFAHGDYASNVALQIAGRTGGLPDGKAGKSLEIAKQIQEALPPDRDGYIERCEVAGPGFLNFFVSNRYLESVIENIVSHPNPSLKVREGQGEGYEGRKVMVEYTDPNVMKPFHIGHLMSNAIGETLARLYESSGANVKRANYYSDVGLAIAKAVWGMRQMKQTIPEATAPVIERTDFLGKAYAFGVAQAEDPAVLEEVKEINKQIYNKLQGEPLELYELGRRWSLEHFDLIYKKLGSSFDYLIPESEISSQGLAVAREALMKGIFKESEGAVVFMAEEYGLHTRVFITKDGLPTYEAKDLALVKKKFELFPFDQSISITASEQNDYFKVVLKAIDLLVPELAGKTIHVSHGMLRLPSGKMSSRTGNVITGEALIADVEKIALTKNPDKEIAEKVAIGAIKYSILRQAPGKDIIFDFEKSLSLEGDSGPYLQYSYARARSVLAKAQTEQAPNAQTNSKSQIPNGEGEKKLMRMVARLPEILSNARKELAPQLVCTYLIELAGAFNSYYASNQIINDNDKETTHMRLALTSAVAETLSSGLWTLGIPVLEHM